MNSEFIYELDRVAYGYRAGEVVLSEVSLRIRPGERVVLLGPNGSGKSTLQKLLAGLIFPSVGVIRAFDRELSPEVMRDRDFSTAFRRKVGFVFQNSDVQLFCSSVLDEMMFGPLAMGASAEEARQRGEELLEWFGLDGLAARLPHHLSGGEKKKAAMAAVLAVNPEVLILDEPTNGLDPRSRRWMLGMLGELAQSGKTIITATHHLELAPELADRVIVLGNGKGILADGKPGDILGDKGILLAAELIDERYHVHLHGEDSHVHIHEHESMKIQEKKHAD